MRVHKDGYIQCRRLTVWISDDAYRRATHCGLYLSVGIEEAVEQELGIELTGNLTFRILQREFNRVLIQIDSDWVQPTRA